MDATGQAETGSTPGASRALSTWKLLVFALVPVTLLLATAEVIVRWSGAALSCPQPYDLHPFFWECDPLLHFRMNHTLRVKRQALNSLGMRGPMLDSSARYRVIALGDSVTFGYISGVQFFVDLPYAVRLQALADQRNGRGVLSVLNAGVCGYNTYHGIMLLRTTLHNIAADLIVVQYGWNDLLSTAGFSGSNAFREPASRLARAGEDLLLRTALYPFAIRLKLELDRWLRERSGSGSSDATSLWEPMAHWTPNVAPADYEHNLRRIVELARARGAEVWLATSADAFTTDEFRGQEDAYDVSAGGQLKILQLGGIRSHAQLAEIHARYNAIVRRVGAELAIPVVDVEEAFRAHRPEHLFTSFDAVHPTDAGHAIEADLLYARLAATGVLVPARSPNP